MSKRHLLGLLTLLAFASTASGEVLRSSVEASTLPASMQTALGLYLTPADAGSALEANPEILFLDVRDPLEVMFVGHPVQIDAVVPFQLATHGFDADTSGYLMVPNPTFLADVNATLVQHGMTKDHPIIVMCRSGGRSAAAANELAKAGYTNVWNLVEGFEGDKDDTGARTVNGWKNAGLPWTYKLTAEQAWVGP